MLLISNLNESFFLVISTSFLRYKYHFLFLLTQLEVIKVIDVYIDGLVTYQRHLYEY